MTSGTQDAFLRNVAYRGIPILKFDDEDCVHVARPPSTDRIAWERAANPLLILPREALLRDPFIAAADPVKLETQGNALDPAILILTQDTVRSTQVVPASDGFHVATG